MSLFQHTPHPRIAERHAARPATVADQLPAASTVARANSWLAVRITSGVGTMWCAYAFAVLALISLPDAISAGRAAIIAWIAQTFLQLVLLSIIIVGQNIQSAAADKRAVDTYKDAEAVLHEALQIQKHLDVQDAALEHILEHFGLPAPGPAPA
ncbi:MAG: hypothetical protein U0V73_01255 [Acidimicrobiia bacterium]